MVQWLLWEIRGNGLPDPGGHSFSNYSYVSLHPGRKKAPRSPSYDKYYHNDYNAYSEGKDCAVFVQKKDPYLTLNSFEGSNGVCITYADVNSAFYKARERLGYESPRKNSFETQEINQLAQVIEETTRILAHEYSLTNDAIYYALPMIDTSKTIIDKYCPDFLKSSNCEVKRYREYNSGCNNLEMSHWGSALAPFRRLIPPQYADGISKPRVAKDGSPLPSPRIVSNTIHTDIGLHDHLVTTFEIAWGQITDHDFSLTGESKDPETKMDPVCCGHGRKHPACFPIEIPYDDPFYSKFGKTCHEFARSTASLKYQCKLGPRSQIDEITSVIDMNFAYGSSKGRADRLRLFEGGLMKTLPVFRKYGLKDLLPIRLKTPDDGCIRPAKDVYCFQAGDNRVNEQLVLSGLHLIMLREHNRAAKELSKINPHWDDERLFQETRHIMSAVNQHITYNEYLPVTLGREVMEKWGLVLEKKDYFYGYDPKVNPSATNAFITSAFRFGHSLLPTAVERWSVKHRYIGSQRLSQMLRQPFDLYKPGYVDQYLMGLANQVAQAMDDFVTSEVTNHLFQDPAKKFGLDLAAINMQRGRDHGVPGFNFYREFCGLPKAQTWYDFVGVFSNETLYKYMSIYKHPDDIDLWSGGVSELSAPGKLVGPTFSCIIAGTIPCSSVW
ncbi:hypothetical protein QYM36_003402 [Artemia franciscana]|uniref:Chorion peroxidase n=1 Tax=Artemia franciscana TaxID=6661 RepID=A0AA88LGT6_ARTSF|nr:hypothetical protein QYM36_003402 [Artemia franciscana]